MTLRPEEKTDAGTTAAVADSPAESRPSSGAGAAGELLRTELQLSWGGVKRRGEEGDKGGEEERKGGE